MEAGLLFYAAHRTSVCQKLLTRASGWFGLRLESVKACTEDSRLNRSMAALLRKNSAVFLVGGAENGKPACARSIFETLEISTDKEGEPRGVRKLQGNETAGYLIESMNQAIVLLPDDPGEILAMLPELFARLKEKFGLEGKIPEQKVPDFEQMLAQSMGKPEEAVL